MICNLPREYTLQSNHGRTYKLHFMFLSGDDREIYRAMFKAIDGYERSVIFDRDLDTERLSRIFLMVLADNPTLFWVDKTLMVRSYPGRTEAIFDHIFPKGDVGRYKKEITREVEAIRQRIAGSCHSDYDVALQVHDILTRNIRYLDEGTPQQQSMLGPLLHRKGVCEGIAFAYSYILYVFGVNCTTVYGRVTGEQHGHAWNIVFLDGKGYHVDVTHDLECTSYAGNHRRFCLTDAEMSVDRTWDSPVVCDSTRYTYTNVNGTCFRSLRAMCEHVQALLSSNGRETEFRVVGIPRDEVMARLGSHLSDICLEYSLKHAGDGDYYHVRFDSVRLKAGVKATGVLKRILR